MREREIRPDPLAFLPDWLDKEPEVPEGEWFTRFPGMIVCGEGELVKTFLLPSQVPYGSQVENEVL